MTVWTYLIYSVIWSLVGGIAGALLAVRVMRIFTIRTTRDRTTSALVLILILVAGAGTVQTVRTNQCVTTYSNNVADALDARTTANHEAQNALDSLIRARIDSSDDPAKIRALFRAYLDSRARAKAQQEAHPYPQAPRDACG